MINWTTEKRKVSDLKDYQNNPRRITDKGIADLKASMEKLGYIDPIAINQDGTIIGGHARKKTLQSLKLKEVDVRVPDRLLSEAEVQEAIVRLNKNVAGEWDFDKLANNFNTEDLIEWGFEPHEIGMVDSVDFPALNDAVSKDFQEMTFILSNKQAEEVKASVEKAKEIGEFINTGNENSNGNALARVCEIFNGGGK